MQLREELDMRARDREEAQEQREREYFAAIARKLPPEARMRDIQDDAAQEIAELRSFDAQEEFNGAMWFVVAMIVIVLVVGALVEHYGK